MFKYQPVASAFCHVGVAPFSIWRSQRPMLRSGSAQPAAQADSRRQAAARGLASSLATMENQPLIINGPHGRVELWPRFVTDERLAPEPCRYLHVVAEVGAFHGGASFYPLETEFQTFLQSLLILSSGVGAPATLGCGSNEELLIAVRSSEADGMVEIEVQIAQPCQMLPASSKQFMQMARVSFWAPRGELEQLVNSPWRSRNGG